MNSSFVFIYLLFVFGFFLLFVSTGLTVCYAFRLFYFVLCGDFNFVSLYSMVDTNLRCIFLPTTFSVIKLPRRQAQKSTDRADSLWVEICAWQLLCGRDNSDGHLNMTFSLIKLKFTLEKAMKTQRGIRVIALLFL
jgi:hypothetical protein